MEKRYLLSSQYQNEQRFRENLSRFLYSSCWPDRHWNVALAARFATYTQNGTFVADDRPGHVLYASAIKLLEEPLDSRRYCQGFTKYNGREIVSRWRKTCQGLKRPGMLSNNSRWHMISVVATARQVFSIPSGVLFCRRRLSRVRACESYEYH